VMPIRSSFALVFYIVEGSKIDLQVILVIQAEAFL
jgi:hypothetical protein